MFVKGEELLVLRILLLAAARAARRATGGRHTVRSFGNLMYNANWMLETEKLFALTIAAVLLSVACEWLIRLVGRAVIRWR